jgi:hypothetical protein
MMPLLVLKGRFNSSRIVKPKKMKKPTQSPRLLPRGIGWASHDKFRNNFETAKLACQKMPDFTQDGFIFSDSPFAHQLSLPLLGGLSQFSG